MADSIGISRALAERALAKLGFSAAPSATIEGLAAVYGAWCRSVPFDNVRKLIHLRANDPAPLPGDAPADFLAAWLAHGAGGTCWANAGALCALLESLGFEAKRGISTMLVAPNLPPNHGTVSTALGGETWLVDGCIQHGEPLLLDPTRETRVSHPAYGVSARPEGPKWIVRWRSPFMPDGMDCRVESLGGDAAAFRSYHEHTRAWSPFNFQLFARIHRARGVLMAARAERMFFAPDGSLSRSPLTGEARKRFIVEEIGISEELAARLPEDVATPPPPGSRSAARAAP